MKKYVQNMTLFQKFTATIILLGLIPMLILSFFISNKMIRDYREALEIQYEHAAFYVGSSIETMLSTYNTISQMPYNYHYGSEPLVGGYQYDNLRQILHGKRSGADDPEADRKREMEKFLQYVSGADRNLIAAHFVGVDAGEKPVDFHYSTYSTYFKGEDLFEAETGCEDIDRDSNKLMLIARHGVSYFSGIGEQVFTVARNYFDIRSQVGYSVYVGTLFLDVRMKRMEQIFRSVKFSGAEDIYIVDHAGNCFYSNLGEKIGTNVAETLKQADAEPEKLLIRTGINGYDLSVAVLMDERVAFSSLRTQRNLMYLILGASMLALVASSVLFSRKLVDPIRAMMGEMERVEQGNFDIRLPVRSKDEIGVLSDRFNQMSAALKKYIDKFYVAQIRQTEAELTALRSQIYPHFLYNTLEIIRMTALENQDQKVSEMIEALSAQIHYLIGTVQDMVPLGAELEIIQKYIYLLNCRISCKVWLSINAERLGDILVPKLILQPIVENAYVHGIKPREGDGNISIEAGIEGKDLEISVMDNGVGMDEEELKKIDELLKGDAPGIKNEYNWQSIGVKNIHERLRYLYGEEYGVQIMSNPRIGTIVCVRMPVIRGEKKDEES